ncbi:MAG: ABC transporter substrate-binding protein [Candidatus Competibacterales bacterium]
MKTLNHLLLVLLAVLGGQALAKEALIVNLVNEPATLDPHRHWNHDTYAVYRNIFDNLITRNVEGEIIPQVATAWESLSDSETAFELRRDITFHNGEPLTAEDVVYSVKRITNPDFTSPQLGQFNKIIDARAEGEHRVVLVTDGPYPPLLAQLVKLSIVPAQYVNDVGDEGFNKAPMGSGPYRFGQWQRGVKVVLERNDAYWRGPPPFASVEFRAVPDGATRVANLRTQSADIIVNLDPDQAQNLEGESSIAVLSAPTERVGYLMMNTQHGPTADPKVRAAVAAALDRPLIIEALLGGYGEVIDQLLTPAHFGYVDGIEPYQYDPEGAKALLAEAGYSAGVEIIFNTSPNFDQRIVQAIQQQLAEVGVDVKIEMSDHPTYLTRRRAPPEQFGGFVFGRWSCACQDADGVLFAMFHSTSIWSKYANPEADRLLEAGRAEPDPEARLEIYRQLHQLIRTETPSIPLYQNTAIYGARRELSWQPTANESFFIMDMAWEG